MNIANVENITEGDVLKKSGGIKKKELGYPELCHNRLDCFCFVLNLVGVEKKQIFVLCMNLLVEVDPVFLA